MSTEFRYRLLVSDPRVSDWVVSDADGKNISGRGSAEAIVQRLRDVLGEDPFDSARTLEWLELQEPSDAGDSAELLIDDEHKLEVVLLPADTGESTATQRLR